MSTTVETKVKEKAEKEAANKVKQLRKKYKLSDFFGCLRGQVFGDDAVFNLGVKA